MIKQLTIASIFLLSLAITSAASAGIIVDFTTAGVGATVNNGGFVFSAVDSTGAVTFDVTASAVIPATNGANNGDIARTNNGLGSLVENTGPFINTINNVAEVLQFTISNVNGLNPGDTLVLENLLSQNSQNTSLTQQGGFGGTFGQQAADSVTLTSDLGSSFVINQSDTGNLGAILLAGDNNNSANTGNTFAHSANNFGFTNSFDLSLTDLAANEGVVIQGFEFTVIPAAVPEPSSALALLSLLGVAVCKRRRR